MEESARRAIAIVGVGAILPDAPDARTFWENVKTGRYSISEVPENRWDPSLYYDADPSAPDKTYSKIGGWVKDWEWAPLAWGLPIPPKVADAMDDTQKWAVACARAALRDTGWADGALDRERTAVVIGNAMAGERHYLTALRIRFPAVARALGGTPSFASLPADVRAALTGELRDALLAGLPENTEDTMPGELNNCVAGRIANLFDLHGPNFTCDAACAAALAAIDAAAEGLVEDEFDTVLAGGIDRNMGPEPFVKFSKIGALSATGTRPYADGADGFVMGEGAAFFVLKRLADAEAAGDRIYAVLRGIAGSSDGKGRGITAPNPAGQRLAVERAWRQAGLSPGSVGLVEGHGTSTRVGDVVEVETLNAVFGGNGLSPGSVPLGSVKSNIGHLKGAAGAAGLLKTIFALHERQLPPSLNFERPNPNIDFAHSPFYVNTRLRPWEAPPDGVRRAGVSAFGFGGTNFHAVLEEHVPGRLGRGTMVAVPGERAASGTAQAAEVAPPLRGALVLGAPSVEALRQRLDAVLQEARAGRAPAVAAPHEADLREPERLCIDYGDAAELAARAQRAARALAADQPAMWNAVRAQGIFRGRGPAPKVAFLYTGQGSQYPNMLRTLREREPVVAEVFDEADRAMAGLVERPLSEILFPDPDDTEAVARAEAELRRTEITQPAVLTVDEALTRLLARYGVTPDLVIGHSLGEYGALVAAGALPFADALEAVSARGREMASLAVEDNGKMVAVFAPLDEIERIVADIDGAVVANLNSHHQAVVGGASGAVDRAFEAFRSAGFEAVLLPVSHAFHTSIVAPASEPLRRTLERLHLAPPTIPLVADVTGELYPMGPDAVPAMLDLLARQVASPVQFVKGLETLYAEGARLFLEVGPKKALHGFAEDVFGDRADATALFTNHPKLGDVASFNQALCGLYAAGLGLGTSAAPRVEVAAPAPAPAPPAVRPLAGEARASEDSELGRLFREFLERASQIVGGGAPAPATEAPVVTGAALGLPGTEHVFDAGSVRRILDGEQEIDVIPTRFRHAMVEKHITRLVKSEAEGPHFEAIDGPGEVIKLAARAGAVDLEQEFGVPGERVPALDHATVLAMGAGIDALCDAGIPLVMHYRTTTKGTRIPERWMLPEPLRDETGVIFASAFPGYDSFADELERYHEHRERHALLDALRSVRARLDEAGNGSDVLRHDLDHRIHELEQALEDAPYQFDRRFLFRVLSMAHAQFAEYVGARGPNTHVNSACASTTQAIALAEDWIRAGRCRRVVVIAADDVTTERLLGWFGSGFLATGAAATDESVEDAALPFDRRRHGMILGMGAAAAVVEAPACARERGLRPICQVLSSVTANSAFHGTRLDVEHISGVMEQLVAQAEARFGIDRREMARELVFVSHETYTPARGGSASAEVNALRRVFGDAAGQIVVANTKGLTGHPMGVGIEDAVAIKVLETGLVPPVPNYREPDPELGALNLSKGGAYPIRYALRLGAGFGSQISMTLMRWVATPDGSRPEPDALGYATRIEDEAAWQGWLARVSGDPAARLEVVQHTLRVRAGAAAPRAEAPVAPPPAPPRSAEQPAPAPPPPPEPAGDPVQEQVLAIVSEKTGYPVDMLDVDLDLEADLGIDTVKQAETFAAIREAWDIPRDENLKLRDYPTLAHAIQFVRDHRPDLAPAAAAAFPLATAPEDAASVPAAASDDDAIRARVLAIVAEKTGYPPDMLDLDLDLEADLGIDTVKQAETFAAIREAWDIPRDENLKLRDYPTLEHVLRFVRERAPLGAGAEQAAAAAPTPEAPAAGAPLGDDAEAARLPRRMPVAVVRPPLEACRETGVALGEGSRVLVAFDAGGVGRALARRLEKRGVTVLALEELPEPDALGARIEGWSAAGPIDGVFWLPALDPEEEHTDLAQWRAAAALRVKRLYTTMRALADGMDAGGRFLVSATRLGGRHGYTPEGAINPLGGAVVGFTKAFARECPNALVKAVDFPAGRKTAELADALIEETLRDPGAVEIGRSEGERWGVGLAECALVGGEGGLALGAESVFAVTGAAGGIVSAITADLAAASGGVFHLLDLVPEPDAADPDLAAFEADREGLKRRIFERLKEGGERATPVQVERELAGVERAHAALAAIRAVQQAGGAAIYHQVDLTDAGEVAKVVDAIRETNGRIDVLLHAAGLERSRRLGDKEPREFDLVFDVKCDGWFNLLHAVGDMPLGAVVTFSSIAGRFGNAGQTDYSAANDLLCKHVSHLRRVRPATRGIAIDWTAWDAIGMASRGSIPQVMEAAGIDMLAPAAGIPIVRRELTLGRGGEVLVAERLGVLLADRAECGGLDPDALAPAEPGPVAGRVCGLDADGSLHVQAPLDPKAQPFLRDHAIDGTAVLPGVMGLEAFAEAAATLLPGWHVHALEDVAFRAPFKFYRDEPRLLDLYARVEEDGAERVAHCRLVGRRTLPGQEAPQETLHFTARVRFGREAPPGETRALPGDPGERIAGAEDVYRVYFHGPAYRVLARAWRSGEQAVGALSPDLPPNHLPESAPLALPPRLVELCFQTAGVYEIGATGRMGLPQRIGRVVLGASRREGPLHAVVTPLAGGAFDVAVVDAQGRVPVRLEGYATAVLPDPLDEALAAPLRAAMS